MNVLIGAVMLSLSLAMVALGVYANRKAYAYARSKK